MSNPVESQAELRNESRQRLIAAKQKKRLDKVELKVEQLTKAVTALQELLKKKGKK